MLVMPMSPNLVIDCHADTLLKRYLRTFDTIFSSNYVKNEDHISKDLQIAGGIDLQVFAIFIPSKLEKIGIEVSLEMIALAKEMEKEGYLLIRSLRDLTKIGGNNGKIGMVLSMEGAVALERNMNLLPIFYELGIRNIGLSWSRLNLFCDGSSFSESKDGGRGLSSDGKELVENIEKLGMIIDISHLNEKGFTDVSRLVTKPFIASHSNAYELCPVSRNLKDNQLEEIASTGGVVGVNFCRGFLSKNPEEASIKDVVKHIRYIAELIGINHVGVGSDFDGILKTPKGLENASKMKDISFILSKEGFSKMDIDKIMGNNFQRVFKKIWK